MSTYLFGSTSTDTAEPSEGGSYKIDVSVCKLPDDVLLENYNRNRLKEHICVNFTVNHRLKYLMYHDRFGISIY